jgi:hypothetical protein
MSNQDAIYRYEGQYAGASLQAFLLGLGQSVALIKRILKPYGLNTIDPDQWYDLDLARAIYADVEQLIGKRMLFLVGKQMVEAAPLAPGIATVPAVLNSLDAAYQRNVRGPKIGRIYALFDGERSALVVYATPFPCHLDQGVTVGCCQKIGAVVSLRHSPGGCRDQGDPACQYRVTW